MYQPSAASEADERPSRPPAPQSVRAAVKLMYAGAIFSAIGIGINFLGTSGVKSALHKMHPHYTDAQINSAVSSFFVLGAAIGVISIALWIWMARANGAGKPWARIVASVLFAFSTLDLLTSILGYGLQPGLILGALIWLAGLGTVVLLWRKDSSAYFQRI
ncbi:MAG TPA: hypothetical protein VFQ44_20145 [Streptosporangiaceae bacterium]|nr:hypothetical protein [Streptosporangiaceae bacterium]